ncbi:MAG: hypothetical protein H6680_06765 [Desulfobacteraceae bacterium]|nr:hypothetical protein [Desulfobacteraceae bacterium]
MAETIKIHARVELDPEVLENVKNRCKEIAKKKNLKMYEVDPADMVGELISKFLDEKNINEYSKDIKNYPPILQD